MNAEIEAMKAWCLAHYEQGADTMVECWGDADYAELFVSSTSREAWRTLKAIAAVYQDRQADARNSAF